MVTLYPGGIVCLGVYSGLLHPIHRYVNCTIYLYCIGNAMKSSSHGLHQLYWKSRIPDFTTVKCPKFCIQLLCSSCNETNRKINNSTLQTHCSSSSSTNNFQRGK